MPYSNKTIAELCRAPTSAVNTNAELELLFIEFGLSYSQFAGGIEPHSNALVRTLREQENHNAALTRIVEYVIEHRGLGFGPTDRLLQSLRLDGFEWHDGGLVPTTPEPAGLAVELSQLERDLQDHGLNVAGEHYREAYESFVARNWEASNGQVRSFMEDLLIELGRIQTSNVRSNAEAALHDLRTNGFFDDAEWQMTKAFWQSIQDNGPHHGLSHEQEALFRLHVATSVARYALHKLRSERA